METNESPNTPPQTPDKAVEENVIGELNNNPAYNALSHDERVEYRDHAIEGRKELADMVRRSPDYKMNRAVAEAAEKVDPKVERKEHIDREVAFHEAEIIRLEERRRQLGSTAVHPDRPSPLDEE